MPTSHNNCYHYNRSLALLSTTTQMRRNNYIPSFRFYDAMKEQRETHQTIQLDATPSVASSWWHDYRGPNLHHCPVFMPDAIPVATLPSYPGSGQAPSMLVCIPGGLVAPHNNKLTISLAATDQVSEQQKDNDY